MNWKLIVQHRSPPSILTLLEMHRLCPEVFERMEIYLDGGIRRGTDILKALCLGATAVCVGRPFLYSLVYGEEGAVHLVNSKSEDKSGLTVKNADARAVLKDEMISNMKTLGINDVAQAHPGLVNTLAIDHMVPSTEGHPYIQWKKARL
jgi:L-lactate dehydrogenase (cytochrome)